MKCKIGKFTVDELECCIGRLWKLVFVNNVACQTCRWELEPGEENAFQISAIPRHLWRQLSWCRLFCDKKTEDSTSNFKFGYSTRLFHVIQSPTYSGYIKCEILFRVSSHTQFQTWSLAFFLLGSTFAFNMETM